MMDSGIGWETGLSYVSKILSDTTSEVPQSQKFQIWHIVAFPPPSDILWFGKHDPAVCSLPTASLVLIWTVTTSCHLVPLRSKVAMCSFMGIIPNYANIHCKQWHLCFSMLHHFWQSGAHSSQWLSTTICLSADIQEEIVCLAQSKW